MKRREQSAKSNRGRTTVRDFRLGTIVLRRVFFAIILGIAGTIVLASLGFWQLQRLEWKETLLAERAGRLTAAPVALPARPTEEADQYLSVAVEGAFLPGDLPVLASTRDVGAMFRIIAPFETTTGRRLLVDRGYVLDELKDAPRPAGQARLIGNLHWPDEIDSATPAPDLKANIWFGRDVAAMAQALSTEPVLLVVRETSEIGTGITPLPVDTASIPNNHFSYAVQWFGFAIVWAAMSLLLIWRQARKHESD